MTGPRAVRLPDAARAPAGAVADALSEVARLGGFFVVRVGGPDRGWQPLARSSASITDLAEAVARRHRTDEPRVGVSIAQLGHAARLWSPVLATAVRHGIVLDLDGLQRADDGPALRLPRAAGWYADALGDLAAPALYAQVTRQLRALAEGLRVKVAPRLLDTGHLRGTGATTGPGLGFRRRSCCLYHRAPNGTKCGDCGLAGTGVP
ncbi:(2Fe-2S)-binding protein [Streptomyces albidoflavus]